MTVRKVFQQGNKVVITDGKHKDKKGVIAGMEFDGKAMEMKVFVNLIGEKACVELKRDQFEVVEG